MKFRNLGVLMMLLGLTIASTSEAQRVCCLSAAEGVASIKTCELSTTVA